MFSILNLLLSFEMCTVLPTSWRYVLTIYLLSYGGMFTLFGVMTNVLKIVLCITLPILPMPCTVVKSIIEGNHLKFLEEFHSMIHTSDLPNWGFVVLPEPNRMCVKKFCLPITKPNPTEPNKNFDKPNYHFLRSY